MTRFQTLAFCFLLGLVLGSPAARSAAYNAGTDDYDLEKPHTQILFSVNHLGFSHSYGKFLDYEGYFSLDYNHPESASVAATIHTASVEMNDPGWTGKVRALFKPAQFPDMVFKSTSVKILPGNTADVYGDLTLLGVTRPVTLHVAFNKAGRNPFGDYICGFSATADIERSDFGMTDYLPFVGDDVHIVIEVEGKRRDKEGQGRFNP